MPEIRLHPESENQCGGGGRKGDARSWINGPFHTPGHTMLFVSKRAIKSRYREGDPSDLFLDQRIPTPERHAQFPLSRWWGSKPKSRVTICEVQENWIMLP